MINIQYYASNEQPMTYKYEHNIKQYLQWHNIAIYSTNNTNDINAYFLSIFLFLFFWFFFFFFHFFFFIFLSHLLKLDFCDFVFVLEQLYFLFFAFHFCGIFLSVFSNFCHYFCVVYYRLRNGKCFKWVLYTC